MPQVSCPACTRPLSLPDNMLGMQVRCPLCNHVFQAGAPGGPPPAPPPPAAYQPQAPAPAPPPPGPPPRPGGGGYGQPQEDYGYDDRRGREGYGDARARAVAGSAAGWMVAAASVNVAIAGLTLLMMLVLGGSAVGFGGGREAGAIVGVILMTLLCTLIVYVTPAVFLFIGASSLRGLRNKGLIITGAVMAFVVAGLMLIGVFISVANVLGSARYGMPGGAVVVVLLVILLQLGAIAVNLVAGIKALTAIGNPAVQGYFR